MEKKLDVSQISQTLFQNRLFDLVQRIRIVLNQLPQHKLQQRFQILEPRKKSPLGGSTKLLGQTDGSPG